MFFTNKSYIKLIDHSLTWWPRSLAHAIVQSCDCLKMNLKIGGSNTAAPAYIHDLFDCEVGWYNSTVSMHLFTSNCMGMCVCKLDKA